MQATRALEIARLVSKRNDLEPEHHLQERYGMTSLSLVLLITQLYEECGIEISWVTEQDLFELRTLNDVIAMMSRHKTAAGVPV